MDDDTPPSPHQRQVWEAKNKANVTLPRHDTIEDYMGTGAAVVLRAYHLGRTNGLNRAAELIVSVLENPDFEVISGFAYPYGDKMGEVMQRVRILHNMLNGRDPNHGIL